MLRSTVATASAVHNRRASVVTVPRNGREGLAMRSSSCGCTKGMVNHNFSDAAREATGLELLASQSCAPCVLKHTAPLHSSHFCSNAKVAVALRLLCIDLLAQAQVLLRRGGIREGAFKCGDAKFLLFPTGYHTDPELCKPGTATPYVQNLNWDPKHAEHVPIHGMAEVRSRCLHPCSCVL